MSPDLRARADERFARALEQSGARDPRNFFRDWMRDLKARDAEAYRRALAYFNDVLIPTVADEESDPVAEWLEYGRVLAELSTPGRAMQFDATGRATPYARPVPPDHMVLHVPEQATAPALVLGIPPKLSTHQRAAYDLLVKQSMGDKR
ncbi:MAG TPA: hypothetical protein VF665_09780 [Longimicrobium sp.]|jgi:hypothetical protein|uniref:hypothetical protein n=1 Tax=Longimicrobium sp. TaxID=2029185 RepID=UPI002EDA9F7D